MSERNQQFDTYEQWVNKASSWLTRFEGPAICVDAKGRYCRIGRDFMRARDDGGFPIRWYWPHQIAEITHARAASTGDER